MPQFIASFFLPYAAASKSYTLSTLLGKKKNNFNFY